MQKSSRPKNIPLIVGICVPLAMIIFVAISIYVPGLFIQPKYDFLYSTEEQKFNVYTAPKEAGEPIQYPYTAYETKGGQLVKINAVYYSENVPEIKLYYYDVAVNEPHEITFEEAAKLKLSTEVKSPDGFEIAYGNSGGGMFPFFYSSGDYESRYLKGNGVSKKLNISTVNSGRGYINFTFLGWVEK